MRKLIYIVVSMRSTRLFCFSQLYLYLCTCVMTTAVLFDMLSLVRLEERQDIFQVIQVIFDTYVNRHGIGRDSDSDL